MTRTAPILGTAQKCFLLYDTMKGKLRSKFGKDKWRHNLVYRRRTDEQTDGHVNAILYSVQCCALHWADNEFSLL